MKDYDPKEIEKKWQKVWEESKQNEAEEHSSKPKYYSLIEFPYPSGEGLHVGHPRPYIGMDVISRKRRMEGYNVLYPIGFDAFGLPAENYAIKTGRKPADITAENIVKFRKQIDSLAISFDWSRQVNTTDPKYYKWTQWLFLKFLEHDLAYKAKMLINWCPKDKIGLANEEVVDGKCERCGTVVEKREKEQWMLAITKYAERLDKDLDDVDYPERVKLQQRNWIGKSEGAEISFEVEKSGSLKVFTTRPDTIFGATFIAIAPQVAKKLTGKDFGITTDTDRENKEKVGMDTGLKAKNPASGEKLPVWVVNYVSAEYGTGAIMGVPAHDDRDFEFAKKYNLPIRQVIAPIFVDKAHPTKEGAEDTVRHGVIVLVKHWSEDKYLLDYSPKFNWKCLFTGGIEEGEDPLTAAKREVQEETGYQNIQSAEYIPLEHIDKFHAPHKGLNRTVYQKNIFIQLADGEQKERTQEEKDLHHIEWLAVEEMKQKITLPNHLYVFEAALRGGRPIMESGVLMNSGEFSGRSIEEGNSGNAQTPPRYIDSHDPPIPGKKTVQKKVAHAIIESPDGSKVLILKWHNFGWVSFVSGGVDDVEKPEDALVREIKEETGYTDIKEIKKLGEPFYTAYHAAHKGENREAEVHGFHVRLASLQQEDKAKFENEKFDDVWVSWDEARKIINQVEAPEFWKRLEGNKESKNVIKEIVEAVGGTWVTKFKLRDWIFSRQRYWGEPIPVIHCEKCGIVPVPEKDLPVLLPEVDKYEPTDSGESPLASIDSWVSVECPKCGGPGKRETDTMPNWAGSSWYFLRYTDPHNDAEFASKDALKQWMAVDWYNGGMEHTTLHLLYSRFWNKFFFDVGLVPTSEPYKKRTSHGFILAENGEKMSKSRGNVVNPNTIVDMFGADTLRVYEMFMGPFEQAIAWSEASLVGPRRFIERVWKMGEKNFLDAKSSDASHGQTLVKENSSLMHQTIKKVSEDIESMGFNTAISALMIWVNDLEKREVSLEEYETLLKLLAPFAPHVAEELWLMLGHTGSIHMESWPSFDASKLQKGESTLAVQVNGKVRGSITLASSVSREEAEKSALAMPEIAKWLSGKEVRQVIFVPGRIVNIVTT